MGKNAGFLLFTRVRKHYRDKTNLWALSILLLSKTAATLENWNQTLPEITEQLILAPFLSIIIILYSFNSKIINAELLQTVWALLWVSNESCHSWKLRALLAWQHPTLFSEFCCQSCLQSRANYWLWEVQIHPALQKSDFTHMEINTITSDLFCAEQEKSFDPMKNKKSRMLRLCQQQQQHWQKYTGKIILQSCSANCSSAIPCK